jgi:hypothetical protein
MTGSFALEDALPTRRSFETCRVAFPAKNEITNNMMNDIETRATLPWSWPMRAQRETENR